MQLRDSLTLVMVQLPPAVQSGVQREVQVRGCKSDVLSDLERGHVTYEVYIPFDLDHPGIDQIDTHGEFMLKEDLRALATDFLVNSRAVALEHLKMGGEIVNAPVIESFVNDERYNVASVYPGAWVVTLDFSGEPELHEAVKDGEYKTVSWTCQVWQQEVLVSQDAVADDPYEGKYDENLSVQDEEPPAVDEAA